MHSLTDTSLSPLQTAAHGSGSMGIATPSSCRTCTNALQQTTMLCCGVYSLGCAAPADRAASAAWVGCGRAPGFAPSHRRKAPQREPAARHRDRHIAHLGHKVWIAGELEGLQPVRLQAEGAPDALHG